MGGFWSDSVPEETLSRDEAGTVLRRLFRMLRPQRVSIAGAVLVLLDGGKVIADGTHDGLLESSAEYREVLARAEVEKRAKVEDDTEPVKF